VNDGSSFELVFDRFGTDLARIIGFQFEIGGRLRIDQACPRRAPRQGRRTLEQQRSEGTQNPGRLRIPTARAPEEREDTEKLIEATGSNSEIPPSRVLQAIVDEAEERVEESAEIFAELNHEILELGQKFGISGLTEVGINRAASRDSRPVSGLGRL
jgi:hypothetical protein